MKILMVAPGNSVHSKRPLNFLLKQDCEVVFWDSINPLPQGANYFHFVKFPILRGKRFYQTIASELEEIYVKRQLRKIKAKYDPDITHFHWINERVLYFIKAGVKPIILSVWGTDINQELQPHADKHSKAIKGKILSAADLVIVENLKMAERCSILAGKKIQSIELQIGIDTKHFRPGYEKEVKKWKEKLNIPKNSKVILSGRACRPDYNHIIILEAFAKVKKQFENDGILLFKMAWKENDPKGGRNYEVLIKNRAKELGVLNYVRFIPTVSYKHLPIIYLLSDLIINYPRMDSFPALFLEAAACCRPVISCILPTYKGTLADKYFRMIEPGNVDELSNALLEELNRDLSDQIEILKEARDYVIENYNESIYQKKLMEIYDDFVSRTRD